MSGITSGVGLISGLPTADLIDSLITAASRPKQLLQTRLSNVQSQRSAFAELTARLLGLKSTVSRIGDSQFFNRFAATSSNESVLTASASADARPGVYEFTVLSLVSNHNIVSRGFADADSTPVGAGEISIEIGNGRVDSATALGDLNGGDGVRRGQFKITDRAGNTAEIDITPMLDVQEVLDEINGAGGISVHATAEGGSIVLEDTSGGSGTLSVVDVNGGHAAEDLGIAGTTTEARLAGRSVRYLTDSTALSELRDGNGIRRNTQGLNDLRIVAGDGTAFEVALQSRPDDTLRLEVLNNGNGVRLGEIRVTNRAGASAVVDLASAQTIGDVRSAINNAVDENGNPLNVTVSFSTAGGAGSLQITDASEVPEDAEGAELRIEDVTGHAASDLGIERSTSAGSFSGTVIHRISTIGDTIRAINYAAGNDGKVTAAIDGNGIVLTDNTAGGGSLIVEAVSNGVTGLSKAAEDLGIAGVFDGEARSSDLIAGLNTVLLSSLNGGSGVDLGEVSFTSRSGVVTTIDFTGTTTVSEIIRRINETTASSGIQASVNSVGNGIAITDVSGATTGTLLVNDVTGTTAANLGIAGSSTEAILTGKNLQRQYINELTELNSINDGRGVQGGDIQITNARGEVFQITIPQGRKTFGDVIRDINAAGQQFGIVASINQTGDGLLITDTTGGTGPLTIEDTDGQTAEDLRIAGTAEPNAAQIDGSMEIRIQVDAGDTLEQLAAKIRDASPDLDASVVNDGASSRPYRLSVSSGVSGTAGELLFDSGDLGLNMTTLIAAKDAVVLLGNADDGSPLVVGSSTNTLSDVVPGLNVNLTSVSDEPVSLTISQDMERVVNDLQSFVTGYNAIIDKIDAVTSFNPDTEERGVLLGDSSVAQIETRLARTLIQRFVHAPQSTQTLASIGITYGDGGHLDFDEDVFRDKYAENPATVEQLLSADDVGFGAVFNGVLDGLTDEDTGLLASRDKTLGTQVDDLNERIASFQDYLDRKRAQLEQQFANLESVLAGLQDQQTALSQLALLAAR